jgi:hypothetical protein
MPSFNTFGSSTTAQTLENGENGFVGAAGTLAVSGDVAVGMSGSTDLVVLGAIVALDSIGVEGASATADITVGDRGQIIGMGGDAINLDLTVAANITNAGTLFGSGQAVSLISLDAASNGNITNSCTITGTLKGIEATLGTGTFRLTNSGVIETQTGGQAVSVNAGTVLITNIGTIFGNIVVGNTTATTTLRNTGTIHGDLLISGGGEIDLRGGTITGRVVGGTGANTYRIDNADISITDTGTSGTDTVFGSVTYAISFGIDRLALTGSDGIRAIGNAVFNTLDGQHRRQCADRQPRQRHADRRRRRRHAARRGRQ